MRESPALDVIRILCERGAHVRVHDPVALDNPRPLLDGLEVESFTDPYTLAIAAEALILVTDWPEYRWLDLKKLATSMHTAVLLDGRNIFDPAEARQAGFTYLGIGR